MRMLLAVNPFDHWPLFQEGLADFLKTSDALVDGERVSRRDAEEAFRDGLRTGRFQLGLFFDGAELVGFNVVSAGAGWLEGHMLYIRPGARGRGLGSATNAAVLRLARERGLRGFRFLSTREGWHGLDAAPYLTQADGTPVYAYSKEVR